LTQDSLALRAHCDVKTIRNAEKGVRLDASTLKRIADALGRPLGAFWSDYLDAEAPQRNMKLFWEWQEASNRRDVEGMVRCYHPEGTVLIPGAEGLPGGGEFRGLDAIRAQWTEAINAFDTEELTREDLQVDAVGDYVFARAWATAVARATGLRFTALGIHEFVVQDGKFLRHTLVVDTAAIRQSLQGDG
jgi:ketosteroid isomerase-like protein